MDVNETELFVEQLGIRGLTASSVMPAPKRGYKILNVNVNY